MKYVIVNGSFGYDGENNIHLMGFADTLEEAEDMCKQSLAEDYGYSSFEGFSEENEPNIYPDGIGMYEEYGIEYDDLGGHEEIYKVFKNQS